MVPAPVFVPSFEELLRQVRLSKALCCGDDLEAVVGRVLIGTRLRLYADLGEGRITTLLTYTRTENPTIANERSRMCAELLEVELVFYELLSVLPVLVAESSQAQQTWNQVDPLQRATSGARDRLRSESQERVARFLCCARAPDVDCEAEGDGTSFSTDPGENCFPCGICTDCGCAAGECSCC